MKLNVVRRIIVEDFDPKDRALITKLAFPLNQFIEQIVIGLNKNLTIEDNLPFETKSFNVMLDSDGVPKATIQFKTSLKPRGLAIISAVNLSDATFPTGAPFITFGYDSGIVTIRHITGIPADKNFNITVFLIG